MYTDVTILGKYLQRIHADDNSVAGLSIPELFDMRTIALRVMQTVTRAAEELRMQGIDPNNDRDLVAELTTAQTALAATGRITLASEMTKRGIATSFKVAKFAVTTGLPLTAAAGVGALATYLRMGGAVALPGIGNFSF